MQSSFFFYAYAIAYSNILFYFWVSAGAARAERDKAAARAQVERDAQAYFFHEFRGDLNLVKGALAQVAERTPLLESAVRSARHMADLVNRPSCNAKKILYYLLLCDRSFQS